jgi:hypothetical protein
VHGHVACMGHKCLQNSVKKTSVKDKLGNLSINGSTITEWVSQKGFSLLTIFLWSYSPNFGVGRLIFQVSRSHTIRHTPGRTLTTDTHPVGL